MLIYVPLDQIDDNPFQRRQEYTDIDTLAADIRQRGLLQIPLGRLLFDGEPVSAPLAARTLAATNGGWPGGESFRVQLAFGHRRLRAYRLLESGGVAGHATLPVFVGAAEAMLDAVWSENQHRTDITAIEQAELLVEKLERVRGAGGNQQTVADEWGLDRSTVANKLRLLDLPAAVQDAVRARKLSERQALALLPILRIAEEMRPKKGTQWEDSPNVWEPMKPDKFLSWLVAGDAEVSSDDIRKYREKLLRHVGRKVPDLVATTPVAVGRPVRQAQCKGCPARVDQHCVDMACFDAKKTAVAEAIARAASIETGLPYSDDPAHFAVYISSYDIVRELRDLYDNGIIENLVVGYDIAGQGARLYRDRFGHFDGDGRGVVVLGHRLGGVTQEEMQEAMRARSSAGSNGDRPETAGPTTALRGAWEKGAKAARRAQAKRGRAAFEPLLESAPPALRLALWTLLAEPAHRDKPFDTPALVKALFERTYAQKPGDRDEWRTLLSACGLDAAAADDPDPVARLRDACTVVLDKYYHYDSEYSRRVAAADVAATGALLDAWTGPLPDSMEMMAYWLNRARPVTAGFSAEPVEEQGIITTNQAFREELIK